MVLVAEADTTSGSALARACAAGGAAVVLTGRDGAALGALAAELEHASTRVAVFVGDARDDAERAALAQLLDELFPPPASNP